jgi:hypothetical protein
MRYVTEKYNTIKVCVYNMKRNFFTPSMKNVRIHHDDKSRDQCQTITSLSCCVASIITEQMFAPKLLPCIILTDRQQTIHV